MQARVLGPVELVADQGVLDLGGPKQQAVLALLVAADGRPVAVDRLLDALWQDDPPAKALVSLQAYVSKLRRLVEPERAPRAVPQVLVSAAPGYALRGVDTDVRRFRERAARGAALLESSPAQALEVLDEALGLWRGEAYAGLDALLGEATRLEELRRAALEDRWEAAVRTGQAAAAVPDLERLVADEPLRERRWALLVRALYSAQRQADALDALRRARSLLADELGLDPGPELQRLERDVLAHEPSLSVQVPAQRSGTPPPVPSLPLVGREEPLSALAQALEEAAGGSGRLALVSGEPGIGKTGLLEALTAHASARGAVVAWGRSHEGTASPPFWPWAAVLRTLVAAAPDDDAVASRRADLAHVLPELGPAGPDDQAARFRLYDGVVALLASVAQRAPLVVVLDDLHWADVDSLRLLQYVASGLAEVPVLLVGAHRDAPSEVGPALTEALSVLARLEPRRLALHGLSDDEVGTLLEQRTGQPLPPDVAAAVRDRTEGNPFYVAQLAGLLDDRLHTAAAVEALEVPEGVRDVVRRRLDQLPEVALQLLRAGAVLGRDFDLDLAEHVAGLAEEQVLEAVEASLTSGLLLEDGPLGYRFSHALVRETVLAGLSGLRRARLHAAAARGLEQLRAASLDRHLPALAEHWAHAGPAHARQATSLALAAAAQADERLAYEEASRLYRAALDGLRADPEASEQVRCDVLLGLIRARKRAMDVQGALGVQAEALQVARALGDVERMALAAVAVSLDAVWNWRDYGVVDEQAVATLEQVLDELPAGAVVLRCRSLATLAVELYYSPSDTRSSELAEQAVALARTTGDPALLVEVLQLQHLADWRPDRLDHRLRATDELLALVQRPEHAAYAPVVHFMRACDLFCAARVEESRGHLALARQLAEQHRARTVLQLVSWAEATLLLHDGQLEQAETASARSFAEHSRTSLWGAAEVYAAQAFSLRRRTGRLAELEPHIGALAATSPHVAIRDLHALTLVAAGRADEARERVGPLHEQPALLFNHSWLIGMLIRLELRSLLGDHEAVEELVAAVEPYADQMGAAGSMIGSFGLVRDVVDQVRRTGRIDESAVSPTG